MLSNLLSSVNSSIYSYLDNLVFIKSNIIENLDSVIGLTPHTGIILICNSFIYGFLIYYAISYLLSHITFSQVERPTQFVFKLLLCAIAINYSQDLCLFLIKLCSCTSSFILNLGKSLLGFDISFENFINNVLPADYFITNSFSLFSFDGFFKTSISFGFLSLSISYAIRYILLKVFILISPFAILSLSSTKTSWFFKTWLKFFLGTLILQVFVALILLICFIVTSNSTLVLPSQILHLGMIYTLFKANSFLKEFIGGFTTDVNLNFSNISSILQGRTSR